jgi:hypothetical protein
MSLLFRFDQPKRTQVKKIALDEADFLLCHTPALQIDGNSSQVRRRGFAIFRRRVAIMAAKFVLNSDGAYGGIYLDLIMEAAVIGFTEIFDEIARPGPAIAARWIEPRIEAQRLRRGNLDQILPCFQLLQFVIISDAGQFEAIDFFILTEQGIVRRPKHRIPHDVADVPAAATV